MEQLCCSDRLFLFCCRFFSVFCRIQPMKEENLHFRCGLKWSKMMSCSLKRCLCLWNVAWGASICEVCRKCGVCEKHMGKKRRLLLLTLEWHRFWSHPEKLDHCDVLHNKHTFAKLDASGFEWQVCVLFPAWQVGLLVTVRSIVLRLSVHAIQPVPPPLSCRYIKRLQVESQHRRGFGPKHHGLHAGAAASPAPGLTGICLPQLWWFDQLQLQRQESWRKLPRE